MRGDGACASTARADLRLAAAAARAAAAAATPPLELPPLLGFPLGALRRLVRLQPGALFLPQLLPGPLAPNPKPNSSPSPNPYPYPYP